MWNLAVPEATTLHALDETGSTNSLAKQLAESGGSHFSLVVAKSQSVGRGRHGREWVSPEGNVFWSMLVRTAYVKQGYETLPFVAGLSVYDALSQLTGKPSLFKLKWPNDILLNGRKISGILIETSLGDPTPNINLSSGPWAVVGIGINVAHYPVVHTRHPATSLHKENFPHISRDEVIQALTSAFVRRFNQWETGGYDAIKNDVITAMGGIGQDIVVRISEKPEEDEHGIFVGLDPAGLLILCPASGVVKSFAAGDVFLNAKQRS